MDVHGEAPFPDETTRIILLIGPGSVSDVRLPMLVILVTSAKLTYLFYGRGCPIPWVLASAYSWKTDYTHYNFNILP